jgi:hypothetical protein
MTKTWKLQAAVVATTLGLAEADAKTLTEAYQAARTEFDAGMRDATSRGGRGGEMAKRIEKVAELRAAYASKLTEALGDQIGKDAVKSAVAQLTVLDRVADRFTDVVDGLSLDDSKMQKAMALIGTYSADARKASDKAVKAEDFAAIRTAREELKTALDDGMSKVLNETQLAKWKETTKMRGRGGRGGGSGDGAGRGGRGARGGRGGRGSN